MMSESVIERTRNMIGDLRQARTPSVELYDDPFFDDA